MAVRIEHDGQRQVNGVVYVDGDGKMQEAESPRRRGRRWQIRWKARDCYSIATPTCFRTGLSQYLRPDRPQLHASHDRQRLRHVFDRPVHMYRGTTMAGIIMDEARHDPKRGFSGGYEMETLSLGLPFIVAFLNPGALGRIFKTAFDGFRLKHGRNGGWSARTCRKRPTASRSTLW